MANRHHMVDDFSNYPCRKHKEVCSYDNRLCRQQCYKNRNPEYYEGEQYQENASNPSWNAPPRIPKHDNMDVIEDVYGYKMPSLDERLADKQRHTGNHNKKALEGATMATRAEFQCHFTDELEEHYRRRWWDNFDYPANEENWWSDLDYYDVNYNSY